MAAKANQPPVVDDDLDEIEVGTGGKTPGKGKKGADKGDDDAVINKKLKKEKKNKKDKSQNKNKGKGGLIVAVLFLLIVGALIAVVGFNVFGIRDKYLSGIINEIPIVNNIISTGEETPEYTNEQLLAQIASLQTDIENKDKQIKDLQSSVDNYIRELEPLQNIEQEHIEFKQQKEEFETALAMGDTKQYQKWYESIDPEQAGELYKEAVEINVKDKEVKDFLNKVSGMDAGNIAKAMETFITTDMELIIQILRAMTQETASEVMDAMTDENRGAVIRQMRPEGF